jgi:hypothetical protein
VNIPLTFRLGDEHQATLLHVGDELLHHAVDAVDQHMRTALRQDGLPADRALVLPLTPLSDAVQSDAVGAVKRLPVGEIEDRNQTTLIKCAEQSILFYLCFVSLYNR